MKDKKPAAPKAKVKRVNKRRIMNKEIMYQFITRDNLRSELMPMKEPGRRSIQRTLNTEMAGYSESQELIDAHPFSFREYLFRRTRLIEVYEYEEVES